MVPTPGHDLKVVKKKKRGCHRKTGHRRAPVRLAPKPRSRRHRCCVPSVAPCRDDDRVVRRPSPHPARCCRPVDVHCSWLFRPCRGSGLPSCPLSSCPSCPCGVCSFSSCGARRYRRPRQRIPCPSSSAPAHPLELPFFFALPPAVLSSPPPTPPVFPQHHRFHRSIQKAVCVKMLR